MARHCDQSGAAQFLYSASAPMVSGDSSFVIWVQLTLFNGEQAAMACWDNGNYFLMESDGPSKVLGATSGPGGLDISNPSTPFSPGTWQHFAMIRRATTLDMYLAGTLIDSHSGSNGLDAPTIPVLIGASGSSGSPSKLAYADFADAAIFDRPLSGTEVGNLAALTHRPGDMATSLSHWWKLDGSGATEADSAGSNTLTVVGATPSTDPPYITGSPSRLSPPYIIRPPQPFTVLEV